jgi:hypothetical protein
VFSWPYWSLTLPRRPNLFIVGAPKCGTTSLYEYLEGHPDVYMSPVKEPMYFCPDARGGQRRRFEYGEEEQAYLDLFAGADDEKVLGEASTRYLASHVAPRLVHQFEPAARIVVMLRNPVDMMYSLHGERVSFGREPLLDFEQALAADADRMEGRNLPEGASPLWAPYRNAARYGEQLSRWIDEFGRDAIRVIIFDDFTADTAAEFRRLLEFLGIDPEYQPASFSARRRSHRRRRGPLRRVVESRPARWVAHRLLPAMLGRTNSTRLVWRFRQSRLNLEEAPRKPLRADLRQELYTELTPDVERLSTILGRDLVGLWFGRSSQPVSLTTAEVSGTSDVSAVSSSAVGQHG